MAHFTRIMDSGKAVRHRASAIALGTMLCMSALHAPPLSAFSGEPGTVPNQSTIHYSLVRALATCAGFSDEDAEIVATYSELTDLLQDDGYDGDVCGTTLPLAPDNPVAAARSGAVLTDLIEGPLNGCARWKSKVYPIDEPGPGDACFSDRFQAYGVFFHMPSDAELENIRTWAFTPGVDLIGDRAAAYGGETEAPLTWQCVARWNDEVIDTGHVESGSLEALGMYLHSRADRGSHFDCYNHAVSSDEPLDLPTHHGQWGVDTCSFFHHIDEFEQFSTDLGEAPIYRTLAAAVGRDAMLWLYNDNLPYPNDYNFPGLYADLLAWRQTFSSSFSGRPAPIPMDLDDPDYQVILYMIQYMITGHPDGGYLNGPLRQQDALDIQNYCKSILTY